MATNQGALVKVMSFLGMSPDVRMLHVTKRHPLLRFASRGEHDADHRLHPERIDHDHDE